MGKVIVLEDYDAIRPLWIFVRTLAVVIIFIIVRAPFHSIAGHIVQTIAIRREAAHQKGFFPLIQIAHSTIVRIIVGYFITQRVFSVY